MVKKILYIFVALVVSFLVFTVSLNSARSKAVVVSGKEALANNDYDFFLKWNDNYSKEAIYTNKYEGEENSTEIRVHSAYATEGDVNGFVILVYNINTDLISMDETSLTQLEKNNDNPDTIKTTKFTVTADNGATWTYNSSTYGYDELPMIMLTFTDALINANLKKDDVEPKYITSFKMVDKEGFVFYESSNPEMIKLEKRTADDWNALIDSGDALCGYTEKEFRNNFGYPYPEMWSAWLSTIITLVIFTGLGLFVFWPKKSYVPKDTVDKEKYTFAPVEKKVKPEIDTVDKVQKERESRENRYKNVRSTNDVIDAEVVESEENIENAPEDIATTEEDVETAIEEKTEE